MRGVARPRCRCSRDGCSGTGSAATDSHGREDVRLPIALAVCARRYPRCVLSRAERVEGGASCTRAVRNGMRIPGLPGVSIGTVTSWSPARRRYETGLPTSEVLANVDAACAVRRCRDSRSVGARAGDHRSPIAQRVECRCAATRLGVSLCAASLTLRGVFHVKHRSPRQRVTVAISADGGLHNGLRGAPRHDLVISCTRAVVLARV